jgi:hypothetical protein
MLTSNPPALQLYSVREQLPADRKGVLQRIAAAGYGAVEAFNVLADPDGLRSDLDEAGLEASTRTPRASRQPTSWPRRRRWARTP